METPSEWAKRFNHPKTGNEVVSTNPEPEAVDSPATIAEFPSEPFQCPTCGQLLAPACRVCVACKHIIDPAEIRTSAVVSPAAPAPRIEPRAEPLPYPWRIFFAILGISFLLALLLELLLGEQTAQLAMGGVQTLAGAWVFYDASRQRIPRPLRWAVGTMLLPVVIFPWYLARRKTPQLSVPFVEAEVGPVARFMLIALLFFILGSLIFYLVQNPPGNKPPASGPKIQQNGGGSPSRVTKLRLKNEGRQRGADLEEVECD